MSLPVHVFVDFDGTISLNDTTDLVLERFALPEWHQVEAAWEAGAIGSRECMAQQVGLIRATPAELDAFVKTIPLDPAFTAFAAACEKRGIALTVVSDGLDRSIAMALGQQGLSLPIRANRLEWQGGERWRLAFPYGSGDCAAYAGHCKCRSLGEIGGAIQVLVGDGRSDFCAAAGAADMVFAKGKLVAHCRQRHVPHMAFDTFGDLNARFDRWLETLPEAAPVFARAARTARATGLLAAG